MTTTPDDKTTHHFLPHIAFPHHTHESHTPQRSRSRSRSRSPSPHRKDVSPFRTGQLRHAHVLASTLLARPGHHQPPHHETLSPKDAETPPFSDQHAETHPATVTAQPEGGTEHEVQDAKRCMNWVNTWQPSFTRRQSWSVEDQKREAQMGGIGDVKVGPGFSERPGERT